MTTSTTRSLLVCGMLSSLLYLGMNAFIPLWWPEYSSAGQTVSELSAIGAPTRTLWVIAGTFYTVLYALFGWGVCVAAEGNRRLRIAGGLIVAYGVAGLFWPPMHLRGEGFTMTDTLHIAFTMFTLLLMLLTIGFASTTLGAWFRRYSVTTVLVWLVCGVFTSLEAPGVAQNLPTPWIGVWERINIAAGMLWVMVLAGMLLRRSGTLAVQRSARAV